MRRETTTAVRALAAQIAARFADPFWADAVRRVVPAGQVLTPALHDEPAHQAVRRALGDRHDGPAYLGVGHPIGEITLLIVPVAVLAQPGHVRLALFGGDGCTFPADTAMARVVNTLTGLDDYGVPEVRL